MNLTPDQAKGWILDILENVKKVRNESVDKALFLKEQYRTLHLLSKVLDGETKMTGVSFKGREK